MSVYPSICQRSISAKYSPGCKNEDIGFKVDKHSWKFSHVDYIEEAAFQLACSLLVFYNFTYICFTNIDAISHINLILEGIRVEIIRLLFPIFIETQVEDKEDSSEP